MRRITPVFFYLAIFVFMLQSCASAEKMVERGQYDQAITLAQRKLSGKQKKNPKLVRAAEEAFAKVTARDLREIDRMKGREDAWGRINSIYRNIRARQDVLRPLLPLTDKNGYTASFNFIDVSAQEQESRNKAAAYHYNQANDLIRMAENGDKPAARSAYRELEETLRFFRNYRDAADLQRYAHELGTTHIIVNIENDAPVMTPADFDRRLKQVNVADLNSFWQEYHLYDNKKTDYDYQIKLRITSILVSPEVIREREYVDSKEIEDGFDYVLDKRGNVMKDSLGNDIKVVRKVTVNAVVLEVLQQKEANVQGVVEVYNIKERRLIRTQPLAATALFENYASTFQGDKRALSHDSRNRIGNRPVPFPASETMILQAADQLKPALMDRILDYNHLVGI
jgi:hypothetical protein